MKKTLLALAIMSLLSGCAVIQSTGITEEDPTVTTQRAGIKKEFDEIPSPAAGKPISVAVYSFQDKTGQRRPAGNIASLSTAVTQGAEAFLIQALQNVGRGEWFDVVERVGIDNLTKERLIIRQMREAYEGKDAKPLMPMQFAGIILEGGIIGYDQSTSSGGAGARILGLGKQTQWSTDSVTVSLRAISVNTGKVLASVTVQKTILSSSDSVSALKFYDAGTKAFEAEAGITINEPGTYAVKAAVELAVVELIKEGQRKQMWAFKTPDVAQPVISSEVRKEEKKDELVQEKTETKGAGQATPADNKPNDRKTP
jgi:curli production assembly/transport component CsgG